MTPSFKVIRNFFFLFWRQKLSLCPLTVQCKTLTPLSEKNHNLKVIFNKATHEKSVATVQILRATLGKLTYKQYLSFAFYKLFLYLLYVSPVP